jgi:hypothetical protein
MMQNDNINPAQKDPGVDKKSDTCGTSSTFNFVIGIISIITAAVLGYIGYIKFFQ